MISTADPNFPLSERKGAYHPITHMHTTYTFFRVDSSPEFFLKSSPMNPTFLNYRLWLSQVSTIAIVHTMSAGTSRDLKIQNHLQRELGYNESKGNLMVKNSCIKEKMMPI